MSACFCFGAGASGAAMSVSVLSSVGLGMLFAAEFGEVNFWGSAADANAFSEVAGNAFSAVISLSFLIY